MTSFLEALRWDWVSAGCQLALCAVILGSWLHRRVKRRPAARVESSDPAPSFAREVLLQTIRQQTELALQSILAAVAAERDKLLQALAGAGSLRSTVAVEPDAGADAPMAFRWGDAESDATGRRRYAGMNGLAEQGLSPRQIADRLKLPAGEIELALKLQGAIPETTRIEAIRQ